MFKKIWRKLPEWSKSPLSSPEKKEYTSDELLLLQELEAHLKVLQGMLLAGDSQVSLYDVEKQALNYILSWDFFTPQEALPPVWLPLLTFSRQSFTGVSQDRGGGHNLTTYEIEGSALSSASTMRRVVIKTDRDRKNLSRKINSGALSPRQLDEMLERAMRHIQYFVVNYHREGDGDKLINWQVRIFLRSASTTQYVTLAIWSFPRHIENKEAARAYLEECGLASVPNLPLLVDRRSPFVKLGEHEDRTIYLATKMEGVSQTPLGHQDDEEQSSLGWWGNLAPEWR